MRTFLHLCTFVVVCDGISLFAPWLVSSSTSDVERASASLFGKADYTRAAGLCFIVAALCDLVAVSGARNFYNKDDEDRKIAKNRREALRRVIAGCFWAIVMRGIALWFMRANFSVVVKEASLAAGMVFSLIALALQIFAWGYTMMAYNFDANLSTDMQTMDVVQP